ncbi:MAG: 23S rRNA (pseudouridine(1915)-N(3))-methyltransferase RlmH [Bacteroidales bacterium]
MEIILLLTGFTDQEYIKKGMALYAKRLKHYVRFDVMEIPIPSVKGKKQFAEQKKAEVEKIMKHIRSTDHLILLDEHKQQLSSRAFAGFLQKKMNAGHKRLIFLVGGAYGFDQRICDRADDWLSLSSMTFPHQLIRLIFLEQLYRGFTIIHNEPYHND